MASPNEACRSCKYCHMNHVRLSAFQHLPVSTQPAQVAETKRKKDRPPKLAEILVLTAINLAERCLNWLSRLNHCEAPRYVRSASKSQIRHRIRHISACLRTVLPHVLARFSGAKPLRARFSRIARFTWRLGMNGHEDLSRLLLLAMWLC